MTGANNYEKVVTIDPYRRYIIHRDHRIAGQAILDAIFPCASDLFAYHDLLEARLQPHKVKEVLFCGSDEPNYWSDITDTFDVKVTALRCHVSQVGNRTGLEERMKEQAQMLVDGEDYELAEAFHQAGILW